MRTRWRMLLGGLGVLVTLLVINAFVLDSQTKRAALTAPDGELLELSTATLQVVDSPATAPGRDGPARPVVLLHCYGCSLAWWDPIVPLLNEDHRVVRLDLLGFGGSQKPRSGYAIGDQGAVVAEALSRLGIEGAVIVGHSMGGPVAVSVAEQASELADRVVTIGSSPESGISSLPITARLARTPVIGQAMWRLRPDAAIRSEYGSAFAPGFDVEGAFADPDRVVIDNRAMTYTSYDDGGDAAGAFLRRESLVSRLARIGVPLLAVLGSEDQIVDSEAAANSYRTLPGAEVRVLEGIGHSPNVEAPDDTAELILRFAGA